jgi:fermentation-respiration switch protein FrsA (DUF1100 family)
LGQSLVAMDRKDLLFSSGTNSCAAWLYPAACGVDPGPIVVMAHGLSGTRRDRLGPFAERFAAGGIAALVFDYRGFGDSGGEPDAFDPGRQLDDWRAAIALARCPASTPAGWRLSGRPWAGAMRSPPLRRILGWLLPSARFPSWTNQPAPCPWIPALALSAICP